MNNIYLVHEISGGGYDQDVVGAYESFTAAVFACIAEIDRYEDGESFAGIFHADRGWVNVFSRHYLRFTVTPTAMNQIRR